MHKVKINNKTLSLVFYRVIKAASVAEKKIITRISGLANAGYEFFLQCWLPLSPDKTPEKAITSMNSFLRKLQQNFAPSRDFPMYTMKHAILRLY
jgi:hypothetical protein